jgi:hypothetical protein
LTIEVYEGGIMYVNYTFDSSFTYEANGDSMEGTSTMPVNWTGLYLTETETGYSGRYTTNDFYFISALSYFGKMFEEGGGNVQQSVYVTVRMEIEFTMSVIGGAAQTRAAGKIYHTNTTEGVTGFDKSMVMTFDLAKS